jgi:hypothetical protein
MHAELDEVVGQSRRAFREYDVQNTLLLRGPVPPSTDVDGATFRYDDFASPERPAADFAPAVEESARTPADQPRSAASAAPSAEAPSTAPIRYGPVRGTNPSTAPAIRTASWQAGTASGDGAPSRVTVTRRACVGRVRT